MVDVLVAMGYGGSQEDAGKVRGRSGDEGLDGVIHEDRLGLDVIYLQAKRYTDRTVGRDKVQAFVGSLHGARARKGMFITTSTFTPDARAYVDKIETKVVLIDGRALARHMVEHGVGVSTEAVFALKRIDNDYLFEEA